MTANELLRCARETAKTFHKRFPGETPSIHWLAWKASSEWIPDARREEWASAVRDEIKALERLS